MHFWNRSPVAPFGPDVRPRVATVLSAQPWEQEFVDFARTSGGVRLVCRAYEPEEIPLDVDIIIGGSETSWITPACIKAWQDRGVSVIGVHPPSDGPGRHLFEAAGAHAVMSSLETPEAIIAIARSLMAFPLVKQTSRRVTVVSGPDGAPGRTECAVAIAWLLGRTVPTLLLDLDHRSPSVALRLGLPPVPNVDAAVDTIRSDGIIPAEALQTSRHIQILAGTFGDAIDDRRVRRDILWAAKNRAQHIVVDAGASAVADPILEAATDVVLVCDASPVGLVRAATVATRWTAAQPLVLLNRIEADPDDMVRAARHALGLEPLALIQYDQRIRQASVRAEPPPEHFLDQMEPLLASHRADG